MKTVVVDLSPKFIKRIPATVEQEERVPISNPKLSLLKKIILYGIIFLIVLAALPTAISILPIKNNIELYVIQSGSMEPTIKTGSLTISKPSTEYEIGDIITYNSVKNPKQLITHRIAETDETDSFFLTKGDANEDIDPVPIRREDVKGKILLSIPYLGMPIGFAKTYLGLILMIIIPSTIMAYDEFLALKNSFINLVKNRHEKNY